MGSPGKPVQRRVQNRNGDKARNKARKMLRVSLVLLLTFVTGSLSLKCLVGVSVLSKEVDCTGKWDEFKAKLPGMGVNMTDFGSLFSKAASAAGSRRKRADDEATPEPEPEPEPEAEPTEDPDAYYCFKHSVV